MFVICYDIPSDRRRNKVARLLEGYGVRVQKSLFECHLDATHENLLRKELQGIIVTGEDKVRFYSLCGRDQNSALIWDRNGLSPDIHLWVA